MVVTLATSLRLCRRLQCLMLLLRAPVAAPSVQQQPRLRRSVSAASGSVPAGEWWTLHGELFEDVGSADALQTLLAQAGPRLTVIEWLSPTCQHCSAAQETLASVAGELGARVTFARVACATPAAKSLAQSAGVKAFPLLTLHRGGQKLLELVPSQRGGPEVAARRLKEAVRAVADEPRGPEAVHFTLLANVVSVQEGPAPVAAPKFDYAAMRAAAAAQLAAAAEKGKEEEEEECGSTEEDEECAPRWS